MEKEESRRAESRSAGEEQGSRGGVTRREEGRREGGPSAGGWQREGDAPRTAGRGRSGGEGDQARGERAARRRVGVTGPGEGVAPLGQEGEWKGKATALSEGLKCGSQGGGIGGGGARQVPAVGGQNGGG